MDKNNKNSKTTKEKTNSFKKDVKYKINGLNIDKAEYQEIVLSNSNFPERYR